jgi:CRISPR-associated endonuclease/helicase Cas3
MLYSMLTDADFLDTECFMSPEKELVRNSNSICLRDLKDLLDRDLSFYTDTQGINGIRAEILNYCRIAANKPQGIFSLTVPTGGGKTKSSLSFAIDHALNHNLNRIIYVIPYTSIISQNASVFRSIFGSDAVLEHHSNLEPELETARNRLLSENWDAPVIVTTNIQFFESFYSNRSSACRKIHNVANSVIIFDEAQMLPPEFLKPCIEIIEQLFGNYGCTAVLCTATQPILGSERFLGSSALKNVVEIIPEPEMLYQRLKRVKVTSIKEKLTNEELAEKVQPLRQALTIVNTRRDAKELFALLMEGCEDENSIFHLSTFMCPKHREETLVTIKARLLEDLPCKVVSTQLIEAGVDIDFPVVFRAVAGLDSIAQAAGRCNREGKSVSGEVYVFSGENPPPPGHLRQSAESGEKIMEANDEDPLSLNAISEYYHDFYWKQAGTHGMDKKKIVERLDVHLEHIPFKDIGKDFSIITKPTKGVIIPFGDEGEALVENLQKPYYFPTREDYKQIQRLSVQLMDKVHSLLVGLGAVVDAKGDGQFYILSNRDLYKRHTGLSTDDPQFIESEKLIF